MQLPDEVDKQLRHMFINFTSVLLCSATIHSTRATYATTRLGLDNTRAQLLNYLSYVQQLVTVGAYMCLSVFICAYLCLCVLICAHLCLYVCLYGLK